MKRPAWLVHGVPWHTGLIGILNVDLFVMPVLRLAGVQTWPLFFVCSVVAAAEFQYWFWLTGTVLEKPTRFQYAVYSFTEFLDGWLADAVYSANGYINGALKALGWAMGHLAMICWGAAPFGLWIPGLVFCKAKRWTSGYKAMAFGNVLKVGYFLLGWEKVFSLAESFWRSVQ